MRLKLFLENSRSVSRPRTRAASGRFSFRHLKVSDNSRGWLGDLSKWWPDYDDPTRAAKVVALSLQTWCVGALRSLLVALDAPDIEHPSNRRLSRPAGPERFDVTHALEENNPSDPPASYRGSRLCFPESLSSSMNSLKAGGSQSDFPERKSSQRRRYSFPLKCQRKRPVFGKFG